jgi:hypothetical protein
MEARILTEISAEPGARYTGIQVDCRTTLCRVQLTLPVGAPPAGAPPGEALPAGAPPARPAGASPDAPGGIFAVADALGLEFHIVLAAFDGYGTPTTLAFLKRPAEAETPAP